MSASVYVAKCSNYAPEKVEEALQQSLQALGLQGIIQTGQRIVLKPNLLQAKEPEEAITTHPTLVAAVAKWVSGRGATPIIADSPGGLLNTRALCSVYESTGMVWAAEASGAVLNYDLSTTRIPCPEGRAAKRLDAMKVFVEADAIINLPKLKTHGLVQLTGATKNLFGTVPGITKGAYHARFPSVEQFSAMLIDVLSYYRPVVSIMDAIAAMEGDGPSGGAPRHVGLLLTSVDGVALDVVAATIVGMAPSSIPPLAAAMRRGLTSGRIGDIEVLGTRPAEARVEGFARPHTGEHHLRMIPGSIPSWITNQLLARPEAGPRCTACGVCVENCPVQAIAIVEGRAQTDHTLCFRCYCCHELCPEDAVELHQSLLGRMINR
jgi:uncharacterized protein (DUF362 family)/Pyruvate/2-oxoacid:ferredoxin oxidoreductase delta subunit